MAVSAAQRSVGFRASRVCEAALDGAKKLAGLHSVAAKSWQQGKPLTGNDLAQPHVVTTVGERRLVREDEAL